MRPSKSQIAQWWLCIRYAQEIVLVPFGRVHAFKVPLRIVAVGAARVHERRTIKNATQGISIILKIKEM